MNCKHVFFLLFLGFASGSALSAQEGSALEVVELAPQVVTASPFVTSLEELVSPAGELSGDALQRAAQSSLGATLDGEPGVHSSAFGPGAGRPVIRGFDGDRVRLLNQGMDTFDVSETSPDHGVSMEPLFAEEIEVVRGPASLLYGNAAIGGVVNVIGKEMPRDRALAPVSGQFESSYGSVADEWSAGLALQGGEGDFAWSAGYLERGASDHKIPGFAESVFQREAEAEEHADEEREREEEGAASGRLENSFVDTRSGYVGMAWFGEKGSLGLSYSQYDTDYGVPGHAHEPGHEDEDGHGDEGPLGHEEEEEEEEELVSIALEQSRFSLKGERLDPNEWFESVELQFSYGDYRHAELEGEEVGTIFERDGYELRLTGVHRPLGEFTGAVGLQARDVSFSATGEEAFIPSNDATSYGLFLVERLNTDWGAWEFGGRVEALEVDPADGGQARRRFTTANASAGFFRRVAEDSVVAANLSYAERAPNASELFAFGPHVGTRSFEIGDRSLDEERSVNLDLSFRRTAGFVTGEFTVFYYDFEDYVYLQSLDREEVESRYGELDSDGLRVFRSTAADARFYGFELDLRFHLVDEGERAMHVDLLIDQTRATNDSFGTYLPRIPTRRVGARYEYETGGWLWGVEGRYHDSASRLAPDELPSAGYFLWGLDARRRIRVSEDSTLDLFVVGRNLGDEEARPHTSFLKDLAPLPGRNVRLGLRASF